MSAVDFIKEHGGKNIKCMFIIAAPEGLERLHKACLLYTSDLSAQINSSRLSFAKPEYMEQFLDITPGSASILGLMNDRDNRVQLLIDEDVLKGEYIGCHPCINTSSLRISTKDMTEKNNTGIEA